MLTRLHQTKGRNSLRLLALTSGMMWSATVLLGQTDNTLPNVNWAAAEMKIPPSTAGTSFKATGILGARQTVHTMAGHSPPKIYVAHVYGLGGKPFFHDPSTEAIDALSFSYELRQINPPLGQCVAYAPLILQNNIYYSGPVDNICAQASFTTFQHAHLVATAFTNSSGLPGHPDFSCAGSKFQVGFITANTAAAVVPSYTRTSDIRNWSVTILNAIDPKFALTVNVASGSTYTLQANLTVPPTGTSYGWFVYQVDKITGAVIGNQKLEDPSLWFTTATTFPGWPPPSLMLPILASLASSRQACTIA
ncbi:MAG TPA: hypothetical protein VOA80_06620 [Thermoanaerobaculia bacterium]|nr:hypothetical protein [Thermoanaerobaculia bacterium]